MLPTAFAFLSSDALLTGHGLSKVFRRSRSLGFDFAEALPGSLQNGLQAAHRAQAANGDIAVGRIYLNPVAFPPGLFRRDQSRARADKSIEHNALAMRAIPEGISHHRHGFYGGMQGQISAVAAKAVHARIVPDISAVAPVFAQFDIVDMRRGAGLKDEYKFMLRPVQRTHAAVVLGPD